MTKNAHTSGRFLWHELQTTNAKASLAFHTELFGWTTSEMDMGPAGKYTVLKAGDRDVGGVVAHTADKGIAPHWLPYCSVQDVDAAAKKALALDGRVMQPPTDIPNVGRFAVIVDPQGAALAPFYSADERPETAGYPPIGSFCWTELLTSDPAAAASFYQAIFGWSIDKRDMGTMGTYYGLLRADAQAGGIVKAPMAESPPAWLSYVAVNDVDAAAKRVERLKGKIIVAPKDIPGIGRFAVHADPVGAVSAVFKAEPTYAATRKSF
jgi:predicted enzyme related to lactoylglutathione lyase